MQPNNSTCLPAPYTPGPPSEHFNQCVSSLLMATEELRQSLVVVVAATDSSSSAVAAVVTVPHVMQWRGALEGCLQILDALAIQTDDAVAELETDLFRHCQTKTVQVAQQTLTACLRVQEPAAQNDDDNNEESQSGHHGDDADLVDIPAEVQRRDCQGAIARITEINLLLLENGKLRNMAQSSESASLGANDIIESYVSFQRQVLRSRAKPAIAQLVQERRDGFADPAQQQALQSAMLAVKIHTDDHDDHADDENGAHESALPVVQHHHAPVLTVILGQAAALIHPLSEWLVNLPADVHDGMVAVIRKLCSDSIQVVDEQAQSLTKTVSDWFWEDRPVDDWIQKSAAEENVNGSADALGALDGLVEELAFCCQVQARYQSLIESAEGVSIQSTVKNELLPEWTWKYSSLERYLATQQWQSAFALASPVTIVIGTQIQVPSVVEDAQYLSMRAVERAASTRSIQAIGTVGHAVSHDVWSTEDTGGVHHALLDQRGCWAEPVIEETRVESPPKSRDNGFAASLLDALDDDLGGPPPTSGNVLTPSKPPSAPTSGNFLGFSVAGGEKLEQMQLDTQFCALNGIHAASGACQSLVEFLDSLLDPDDPELDSMGEDSKATAMMHLANEELGRYAEAYRSLLTVQVDAMLVQWCGVGGDASLASNHALCYARLRLFLVQEDYNLDSARFNAAEADERLERELLGPLQGSRLLKQLSEKCETDVLDTFGERIVSQTVDLVLGSLWGHGKEFTDWGSLLLSKQVRKLQGFVSQSISPQSSEGAPTLASSPNMFQLWERLSQVLTVLQLEKPSDWLVYQATSILSAAELGKTLSLRVDFSADAIQAVVASVSKSSPEGA